MPRKARLDYPGLLHHVIGRGIEQKEIFKKPADKKEFLRRLSKLLSTNSMHCYAWCIMDNHFHFLLLSGNTKLSEFMSRLLTGYAVYYNNAYHRRGHLFQNRYKSIVCAQDEYLLPLIRYIHLNPVRAGIIEATKLNEYPWTGHKELIKGYGEYKIIEVEKALSYFGEEKKKAAELYLNFVNDGLNLKEDYRGGGLIRSAGGMKEVLRRKPEEWEGYDERILGCGDFVQQVLEQTERKEKATGKITGLEDILERLNGYYGLAKDEILSTRSKAVREARSVLAFAGSQYLHKRVTEIGKILGISQAAASIAKRKGREIFLRDELEQKLSL